MSAPESPLSDLDLTPLSQPLDRESRAEARRSILSDAPEFTPPWPWGTIAVLALVGIGGIVNGVASAAGRGRIAGVPITTLSFAVGAVVLVGGAIWLILSRRAAWTSRMRLAAFARRNGLDFRSRELSLHPGLLFQQGGARRLENVVRRYRDRLVEVGEFVYETGSGKNRKEHREGYLLLQLDRRLPHMLLDAKSNNGLFGGSNLPIGFDRSQILHLEGDFDKWFTLYCPSGYERDALYVFTPDVMAAFIDGAAHVDVEIIDDRLFVYLPGTVDLDDPGEWMRLRRLVDALWPKTSKQAAAYSDDRVTPAIARRDAATAPASGGSTLLAPRPDLIGEQGRRLRQRVPLVTVALSSLITVGLVVFWVVRAYSF